MGWRQVVQDLARRAGLDIHRWPPYGSFEYHLRDVLSRLRIDLVLDVGACSGGYVRGLQSVGYRGEVISFEAASEMMPVLRSKESRFPNWQVHHVALSAEAGKAELFLHEGQAWLNSIHRSSDFGRTHFGVRDTRRELVELERLDDVLAHLGIAPENRRTLLKTDTQGHDLEVLAGAPHTLAHVQAVQVEVAALHFYEDAPDMTDVLAEMLGRFDIAHIAPVARVDDGLRVAELDCLFVRR